MGNATAPHRRRPGKHRRGALLGVAVLAATALAGDPGNGSLRRVLEPLGPRRVPASGREASDVDTPEDWRRLGDPE